MRFSLADEHLILVRGSLQAFAFNTIGTILGILSTIILARVLGVSAFGHYIYVLTWVSVITMVALCGFDRSAPRFIGEYQSRQQNNGVSAFIKYGRRFTLFVSSLITIIILIILLLLKIERSGDIFYAIVVGALLLPLTTRVSLLNAFLRSLKEVIKALFPTQIVGPVLLMTIIIGLFLMKIKMNAHIALLVYGISFSIVLSVLSVNMKSVWPHGKNVKSVSSDSLHWVKTSMPMMLVALFHLLLLQSDILLVGLLLGMDKAGIYAIASKIAFLINFGYLAVHAVAPPAISQAFAGERKKELQKLLVTMSWLFLLSSIPVFILIAIAGKWMILLFYGPPYLAGLGPLFILAVAHLLNVLFGPLGLLMEMTGNQNRETVIVMFSTFLNIVLNILFIPRLGMVGASIATAITIVVVNFALFIVIRRRIGVNPTFLNIMTQFVKVNE